VISPDILQNDQALDFLEELTDSHRRWPLVSKALNIALAADSPETDDASHAIAAAEIVAAARGHARQELREELAFWAQRAAPKNLDELSDLAVKALKRIRNDSEVADLWAQQGLTAEFRQQIDHLAERLRKPLAPLSPVAQVRKIRVRAGDVFEIPLTDGRFAYGRVTRHKYHNFQIYSRFSDKAGNPPIGWREYLFAAGGLSDELERGQCPIVGHDAWTAEEKDPVFIVINSYPRFRLFDDRLAAAPECCGATVWVQYDLGSLVRRITNRADSTAASDQWPRLPDQDGVLRRMPWNEWNPAWEHKWKERVEQEQRRRPAQELSDKAARIRAKPGDIFQVPLPANRWAYARIAPTNAFCLFRVYALTSDQPSNPPVGSRDFMFAGAGMDHEVERGVCQIVGHDPWGEGEQEPRFFLGSYPKLRIVDKTGERPATPRECISLDCQLYFNLASLTQRIVDHPNGPSVEKHWPVLPDKEGKLRPMPWREWNPEWEPRKHRSPKKR